ncbi:MAG TPA: NAD(P)-binding protein [Polyangia bacterium]|jgi:phytoene dehydrogenase-like protein
MDTNYYDVIVCGGELTGLIAAALLGRRGFRVLLVGHDADRPTFEAGGYTLPRGPALLPALDSPPVARVLSELNCVQVVRRRAPALQPGFQVVLPKHRFDVPADEDALLSELRREFGDDATTMLAATARLHEASAVLEPVLGAELTLPADGFWERREVARLESLLPKVGTDLLAPLPIEHPWRTVVAAPAALGSAFGPNDLGTVTQARSFVLARRGLHRLEGGTTALHALFLDKLGTFAGEKRERLTPIEIVQRRGKAVGIRFRPRDETIGAEHLIWAGPAAAMHALCGEKPRKGRDTATGLHVACYRYGLALLVAAEAIPEGMGSRVFLIADPTRPLLEENAIAVTVAPSSSGRDAGHVHIWAECLVPAPAVDGGPGYLRAVRGRVRKQLAKLIPFFTEHLAVLASPYDGLPAELPAGKKAPAVAVPALPMPPVYSAESARPLDVAGLPHATGIKNLYLAGRENLPGLGVEGEFVSAWGVLRLVAGTQPKKDVRRREVLLSEG